MNLLCEVAEVVLRFRLNQFIETFCDNTVDYFNRAYGAYARWFVIGRFNIYSDKISILLPPLTIGV